MPNYVTNKVQFITDNTETVEFFNDAEQFFGHFVPEPSFPKKEVNGLECMSDAQHEWRCANWGTKWECSELRTSIKDLGDGLTKVELSFLTAWEPPLPVFYAMEQILGVHVVAQFGEFGNILFGEYSHGIATLHDDMEKVPTDLLDALGMREEWEEEMIEHMEYMEYMEELEAMEDDQHGETGFAIFNGSESDETAKFLEDLMRRIKEGN